MRSRVSETVRNYIRGIPKGDTYLEEAQFGLRRILPLLDNLPEGGRVLEVGSGPCIVLAEITARFPKLTIKGIEPMSDGFAFFDDFVSKMQSEQAEMDIYLGGYESFPTKREWDLIFLVNVFEHLPDWRDFLSFVARSLAPGGSCVVLCPNYGFPYESHFKLPVVVNKRITGALFRKRIARFESENESTGLYRSLNFVTLAQVRSAAPSVGLNLKVNPEIIHEMIERLDTDPAFRQRQKWLVFPARALSRTGLLNFLLRLRFVQNHLPYMQFTLSRAAEL
ncbi:class I SAM-dependent methyltransferase [Marimonas sp. MJW-29]|uniref:Class I SAM-dependent methyltransferase n=1 Tax=Sulfitobacter sediminis TaxID=3234186 RepID=A0ABV3RN23_9RHOB